MTYILDNMYNSILKTDYTLSKSRRTLGSKRFLK